MARGHGQVVGIVGEAGVGKSRFVYELTRIAAMHDWRVLRCEQDDIACSRDGTPHHHSVERFLAARPQGLTRVARAHENAGVGQTTQKEDSINGRSYGTETR